MPEISTLKNEVQMLFEQSKYLLCASKRNPTLCFIIFHRLGGILAIALPYYTELLPSQGCARQIASFMVFIITGAAFISLVASEFSTAVPSKSTYKYTRLVFLDSTCWYLMTSHILESIQETRRLSLKMGRGDEQKTVMCCI